MNSNPIGIFDSGAGGLSVLKEIARQCPAESVIYMADTAHCPYGGKPQAEVEERARRITEFMLSQGCKLIVVACNTATAAAIAALRADYQVPFVGMEPAVKPASAHSQTRSIGVLATAGTLKGQHYVSTSQRYAADVNICIQAGEGLVELVETNRADSPEAEALLTKYLQPMVEQHIDQLVLGCTHYPFLVNTMERVLPAGVEIIDPAPSVARQCLRMLELHRLQAPVGATPTYAFHSSGTIDTLQQMALAHVLPMNKQIRASFHANTQV
ncbi:MAG: glutamate racemase [Bacteroidales bacterium]|nr:glutamate racemase [Bacteroidales bacterium]